MKTFHSIGPMAIWALLFFTLGAGLAAESETPPELTIPVCKTAPRLDGGLDAADWQEAAVITKLKPLYLDTALGKPAAPAASIVTGDTNEEETK